MLIAKGEREAGASSGPVQVVDGETGEVCVLNTTLAVDAAGGAGGPPAARPARPAARPTLARPTLAGPAAAFARPPTPLLPDLSSEQQRDKSLLLRAVKQHQQAVLVEALSREAAREKLRRRVLAVETSDWRRLLAKKAFLSERLAALEDIKRLKLDMEVALATKLRDLGMLR
jgi:hypothetical protein